jgi:hypothetical protein
MKLLDIQTQALTKMMLNKNTSVSDEFDATESKIYLLISKQISTMEV